MLRTIAAIGWMAAGVSAYGQAAGAPAEFEAASIKVAPPNDGRGMSVGCEGGPGSKNPGRISCENVTLVMLVASAYNVSYDQLAALDWMTQLKFNIEAKPPAGANKEQVNEMWQRLLIARFKLETHRESRVVPKFDLVVGKDGPKFRETAADGAKDGGADPPRGRGNQLDGDGYPALVKPGMIGMDGRISMYQIKMTMGQLAKTCSGQLGKPVTDATGLNGEYDIRMHWVTETGAAPPPGRNGMDPGGPTLQQALQSQLGLRLEAKRGPVEFLVVDHMEKNPTDN